ncbi:LacI family DNA-binding transcriptional regulator [Ruegeria arenilitoris]|uniref:LacI family DNA-binding transcriptional regulator n=1 Tax=Ruegeria arenilitoris TaxID=1173585 RepID=UPI00147CE9E3|nr:LacI family DNA-binding transcriptional regulator [Ruegeria arenilitoris]
MNEDSPKHRRVTAQTVADMVGVSRSAVSRAFTPGAYVDAQKRKRIHAVAAELGYQPNALAAGLQGGRSRLVAIFVGNMRSAYDTAFVSRLVGKLNGMKRWPILIDGSDNNSRSAIEDVLRYPLDALIVRGGSMSAEMVGQCTKLGIPMISSGRPIDAPGVDNVCCRNAEGTMMMTRMLLENGRRRFGFIAGPQDFYSSGERRNGVVSALEEAGLELEAEVQGDYTVEGGYQSASEILKRAPRIDALICANDATAFGALSATQDNGLDIPGDISVVGFDDVSMASWPQMCLTTVRNPINASVDETIALLEHRLTNPGRASQTVFVDPEIVLRKTH